MLEVNKIHQGDCLELMKEIEDKSIEIIFIKDTEDGYKKGEVVRLKEADAQEIIKEGYAEYKNSEDKELMKDLLSKAEIDGEGNVVVKGIKENDRSSIRIYCFWINCMQLCFPCSIEPNASILYSKWYCSDFIPNSGHHD